MIQGRYDINTPTAPAEAYFARVSAPQKRMVILEDALATHRREFIAALLEMLAF